MIDALQSRCINMVKSISISKARVNLGAVVSGVRERGEHVILEKGGVPVAAVVGIDTIEDLQDAVDMMAARIETKKEELVDWETIRARYV